MSKLKDSMEEFTDGVVKLLEENKRLTRERDEARAKLLNLADATEVAGTSWDGFNIIGDPKSIREFQRLKHRADQLELYQREFKDRVVALTSERDAALAKVERMDAALETAINLMERPHYGDHDDQLANMIDGLEVLQTARAARKDQP